MDDYISPNLPSVVTIEPTNHCNFSCVICPNRLIEHSKKGFLTVCLFDKLLEEIPPTTERINLFMGGEPLLHPQFGYFLRKLVYESHKVKVNTNGSLLSGQAGNEILNCPPDQLVISFDGENKQYFEAIKGYGLFETTNKTIRKFVKKFKKIHPDSYCAVQVIKEYDPETFRYQPINQSFIDDMKSLGIDDVLLEPIHDMNGKLRIQNFKYINKESGIKACSKIIEEIVIKWNGDVVACCGDMNFEAIVSSVRSKSIKDAWVDPLFCHFRQMHWNLQANSLRLCQNCDLCKC